MVRIIKPVSAFQAVSYPPVWNWKEDSQPQRYKNPEPYIILAESLKFEALSFAAQILIDAGYVSPEQKGNTVYKLASLKSGRTLKFDNPENNGSVAVKWRIKDLQSATDKIIKDGKVPDDIGDYFGVKFIARNISDIVALRNAVLNSNNMSSRKCEFTYPSDEGYRSHKSHHLISQYGRRLSIEAMITHEGFEKLEKGTHNLIKYERNILRRMGQTSDIRLSREFDMCSKVCQYQRTLLNHTAASKLGLNALCAKDAVISAPIGPANSSHNNYAKRVIADMIPDINFVLDASNTDHGKSPRRELA